MKRKHIARFISYSLLFFSSSFIILISLWVNPLPTIIGTIIGFSVIGIVILLMWCQEHWNDDTEL